MRFDLFFVVVIIDDNLVLIVDDNLVVIIDDMMMMKMMKFSPKNGDALSGENFIGRLECWHKVQKLLPPLIISIIQSSHHNEYNR